MQTQSGLGQRLGGYTDDCLESLAFVSAGIPQAKYSQEEGDCVVVNIILGLFFFFLTHFYHIVYK